MPSEGARRDAELASVLLIVLRHLESAPHLWPVDKFAARNLMDAALAEQYAARKAEEVRIFADVEQSNREPEALGAVLDAALRHAAVRGAVAKCAAALACADKACRAAAAAFADATTRAARGAHAQAVHDMACTLRECGHAWELADAAAGLAKHVAR